MHLISPRLHGVLDYLVGGLLIALPKLFGLGPEGAELRLPMILGVATIVYSLITDYDLGLVKVLPFRHHLRLDVLSGLLSAVSPWLFGFADRVWGPYVTVGLFELAAVLLTGPAEPGRHARTPAHL